jgi:hypothetical protein
MDVICSYVECITATANFIGASIGNLSVVWSWISGGWHCCEGILINPTISGICGPIISGLGFTQFFDLVCGAIEQAIVNLGGK